MKKIKHWVAFIGTKNLIAICALVVVVAAIGIGVAVSNGKKGEQADKEIEQSEGLQVEENADDAEGDSIDFEDFISGGQEDDKTDTDNDGVVDKKDDDDDNDGVVDAKDEDDNNDGTPDVEDPKHPSYEGTDEDKKDEDKEDDDQGGSGTGDSELEEEGQDTTTGWSPFF